MPHGNLPWRSRATITFHACSKRVARPRFYTRHLAAVCAQSAAALTKAVPTAQLSSSRLALTGCDLTGGLDHTVILV